MNQVQKPSARLIVRLVIAMCLLGMMPAVTARAESAHSVEASRTTARRLVAGDSHACVILSGKVFCWGSNATLQLGTATDVANSSTPLEVQGISTAAELAAGWGHTCALLEDMTMKCWGSNQSLQLGTSSTAANFAVPALVPGLTNITSIAAGMSATCAIVGGVGAKIGDAGGVKCWGSNGSQDIYGGEGAPYLGRRTAVGATAVDKTDVPGYVQYAGADLSSGVARISVGQDYGCAVMTNKTAKCWGENTNDKLGVGSVAAYNVARYSAVDVGGLTGIAALSTGASHACAILETTEMKCWGSFYEGELGADKDANLMGDDYNAGLRLKYTVKKQRGSSTENFSPATSVDASSGRTCALRSGQAACWGGMSYIGAPVAVVGVSDATVIEIGNNFACVLNSSNAVSCWGENAVGQLGNGVKIDSDVAVSVKPVAVQTITFGDLSAKSLGDADFDVVATASSGSAVTLATDTAGVCTVASAKVTLVAPGTCTITASIGISGLYKAADSVSRSFKVSATKAPTVRTGVASNVKSTTAEVNAVVTSNDLSTTVAFVYGKTSDLASDVQTAAGRTITDVFKETDASVAISNLEENTTYYFQVQATNSVDTSKGAISSFTTQRPVGVSINDGAEFTNAKKVKMYVTGPSGSMKAILSNDGGFKKSTTFDLVDASSVINWELVATKDERLPKTVYVKFLTKTQTQSSPYTDDIILDTTIPVLSNVSAAANTAPASAVTVAAVKKPTGAKIVVKARDTNSGVGKIEIKSSKKGKTTTVIYKKPTAASQTVSVKTTSKTLYVRVLDRAANASPWKTVTVK